MSEAVAGWAVGTVTVRVRYSRGADFSGTCIYSDRKILINLGRHVAYPYPMATNLARGRTIRGYWSRPTYTLEMRSGNEIVLFVFMHELYHLLVKRAKRNVRQKESMCDRFAARYIVDQFGAAVRGEKGELIPRDAWDVQDLDGFVAAALDHRCLKRTRQAARQPIQREPARPFGEPTSQPPQQDHQLLLFPS